MRKILLITTFLVCPSVVLLAEEPAAGHGPHSGHGAEMFKQWDANGDGGVSREEAQAKGADRLAKRFDSLDADKNGMLSREELRQAFEEHKGAMKERFEARFKEADSNSDGRLSKDEAQRGMPRLYEHFDEVDTSKDGQITAEELREHHMQKHGDKAHGTGANH